MDYSRAMRLRIGLLPLIFLVACAAYTPRRTTMRVPVTVQKPAEVTIPQIRVVGVFDFAVTPGVDAKAGSEVARKLRVKLIENGHYNLVENWRVKQTLEELGSEKLDQAEPQYYQVIGERLGVDGLLLGTIEMYSYDDVGETGKPYKTQSGDEYINYKVTRTANVQVSFEIIDGKTGMAVAALSSSAAEKASASQSFKKEGWLERKAKEKLGDTQNAEEKARGMATQKLTHPSVLFNRALERLSSEMTKKIAPYYVDENRTLISSGHMLITSGYDFAARQLWDDAKKSWENAVEDESASKAHASAWYNLGIYHEVNDDFAEAEKCFNKAYELSPNDIFYLNSRGWIKERQEEQAKLQEQLKNYEQ